MTPAVPSDTDRVRPRDWALLVAIVLVATAVRAWEAGRAPMWFDELYTTWAARGGFARVLATLAGDVHPPLHTLLVAGWVALGGESTPWLKSLSVLFGVATIVVTFLLGRAAFGRNAGLAAAALLALHPVHVYFSQEARVYALLWLELAAAWWLAWRWLADGRARHGAGYVAAATLALYTHYLAGAVLAFTGAAGLLIAWAGAGGGRRALGWAGLHVAAAVLFLPQLPVFLAQNARLSSAHWLAHPDARDLRDWLRHIAGSVTFLVPVVAALLALALARRETRRPAAFLLWAGLVPVLLAWWLGTRGLHLFTARYMYYAIPPLLVTAAGGLAAAAGLLRSRPAPVRLAPWVLLAAMLALQARALALRGPYEESAQLANAAALLRAEARPGDVIFCADTHALLFLAHYDPGLAKIRLLWLGDHFPYYEGALIIPDSLRVGREAFAAPRAPGSRWWGVRVRLGGNNGPAATAIFDSAATSAPRRFGAVTVWGPQ